MKDKAAGVRLQSAYNDCDAKPAFDCYLFFVLVFCCSHATGTVLPDKYSLFKMKHGLNSRFCGAQHTRFGQFRTACSYWSSLKWFHETKSIAERYIHTVYSVFTLTIVEKRRKGSGRSDTVTPSFLQPIVCGRKMKAFLTNYTLLCNAW
jgi:hypothetical protein